jgi:hypothetical protein
LKAFRLYRGAFYYISFAKITMRFYPYESFYIETHLSPLEIQRLLYNNLQTKKDYYNPLKKSKYPSSKPYYGWASIDKFQISRNTYQNSLLPEILGTIISGPATRIYVRIKLKSGVRECWLLWMAAVGLAVLFFNINALIDWKFNLSCLMIVVMFMFGYLIAILPFKLESPESRDFLVKLFDGKVVQ